MNQTDFELIASEEDIKQRLDIFLSQKFEDSSRSQIQKLITDGFITLNGSPTKANHKLRMNEVVRIHFPPPQKSEIEAEEISLDILYEDDDLIVINKSDEMVVHPAQGNRSGTLVNALLHHCQNLSGIGGVERPGIVHRLDKNTSGIMVVAKHDQAHRHLSGQLSKRTMEREYRALVWGNPTEKMGRIVTHLARHPRDRIKICVAPENKGKLAITNYEVLEDYDLFSYVKLKLETGRTHQIRVHLKFIGHPVFGDPVYNGRKKQLVPLNQSDRQFGNYLLKLLPHQALHARILGFIHPRTNEFMRFECNLPHRFLNVLNKIKEHDV